MNEIGIWIQFADKVGPSYRPFVGATWAACLLVGVLCVFVRLLAERGDRNAQNSV